MKLNKKIETEVLKIYDTWMHSYLHGDVEAYDSFLDNDYHFIGSAKNEEFLNRKDTTKFFEDTGDQFAGKTEIRNETKTIEQFGELIFITHIFDGWFLNENDWNFYARFRFTSVLKNTKDGYRFIYQHFSIPDSKTEEGETIGYDKINDENQELREAITRRTFELEAKNRELEIEGTLERIRAQAVAMKSSSDLLDIVVTMRNEFIKLGHEAHYFWHMMWLPNRYEKAMTSGDGTRIGFVMTLPRHIHGDIPLLDKWEKSKNATVVYTMSVDEAIDYVDKMVDLGDFQNIDPQAPSHDDIRHIGGLTFIMARTTHGEIGYSLPGIVKNPPKEDLQILERFADAFDLAHRRFLDLQKAEQQAREVEIELALERVRSRTMAMQHSDELQEASFLLDEQVRGLGIETWGCAFNVYGEKESKEWFGNEKGELTTYTVPRTGIFKEYYNKGQEGETLLIKQFSGDDCVAHYEFMSTLPGIGEVLKQLKKTNNGFPTFQIDHVVYFKYGYLLFITRESVPEAHDIFKRFAKVFEQTYTRFLDLQKAEAQAREAQIEVALERIRAKTMAMHNSEDVGHTVISLFDEVMKLGLDKSIRCGIGILENRDQMETWSANLKPNGEVDLRVGLLNMEIHPMLQGLKKAWNNGKDNYSYDFLGKDVYQYYHALNKEPEYPFNANLDILPENEYHNSFFFSSGILFVFSENPLSEESKKILNKFSDVFGQTYRRYLDLQKAEAQAREAQIELGLERVRARAMAMQNTNELSDLVANLLHELTKLDFSLTFCIINIINEADNSNMVWATNPEEGKAPESYYMRFEEYPFHHAMMREWKAQTPKFIYVMEGKEKEHYDDYLYTDTEFSRFPKEVQSANRALDKYVSSFVFSKFGGLQTVGNQPLSDESLDILYRFGKVFDLTYTRFNDLKKAEAQAREAQIEVALEKIRSRTMAMQKGEELKDVVVLLYKELIALGVTNFTTCGYVEVNEETERQLTYVTDQGGDSLGLFYLPLDGDEVFDERYAAWKNQQAVFHQTVGGKKRREHLEYAITTFNSKEAEEMVLTQFPDPTVFYCFNFSHGYLHIVGGSRLTADEETLMARFTRVFEQTYARFLDLKKAEHQTREAQINLAVERVRAKALAMHKSEDIIGVVAKLKDEVMSLDIPDVIAATIFLNEGDDKVRMWDLSSLEQEDNYSEVPFDLTFKIRKKDPHLYVKRVWENPEDYFVEIQDEKGFKRLMKWLRELDKNEIADEVEEYIEKIQLKRLYHTVKKLNNGKLAIDLLNPPSDEMEPILTKMGAAFDLAYKRFEDLKKAEAQTKESQIEAALEKVRSRSLAMQKPDELQEVITVVAEKLQELGVIFDVGGVILCTYFSGNKDVIHWIASPDLTSSQGYFVPYFDNPIFNDAWDSKDRGDAFFSKEFPVEAKNHFFEYAFKHSDYRQFPEDYKQHVLQAEKHHLSAAWSKNSAILIPSLTGVVPSESDADIIKRFAKVFEQAYIRFMDLQQAEIREKEAIKQASLDRVRGEIASMRTTKDLERITPLIWKELTTLGVPFFRCGVFIIREDEKMVHAYLSKPDGTSVAALHIPFSDKDNKLIKPTIENWRKQQVYKETWNQDQFIQQTHMFMEKGQIENPDTYDISETPPEQLVLHLIPFKQGMVYVGNHEDLMEDQISLVESLSTAFSVAYSRYEDFKALETAKNSLELTINDLKSTQAQLIQAEKMASLGELTAGIAHEIQNPLNFVNNFSEVSEELVDEMNEELENGDLEEAKMISKDLKDNLSKINHHGKRADAIVKGMLEHSRINKGEKKPTDINALLDEFVRLSYHGLRAKDKSFNVDFKLDLDPNLLKVNVVSSDIGRVILNLVNNAFYACNECSRSNTDKQGKSEIKTYNPEVIVSSKQTEHGIQLSVKDNGGGIPEQVRDKIFQPFFTTKPTGKGTGLGLSLSYDIIKAHGGKLTLESSEGDGTLFSIQIPI
jgi:signal transduction histidine kinase/ketosteroid isomerase-like protein